MPLMNGIEATAVIRNLQRESCTCQCHRRQSQGTVMRLSDPEQAESAVKESEQQGPSTSDAGGQPSGTDSNCVAHPEAPATTVSETPATATAALASADHEPSPHPPAASPLEPCHCSHASIVFLSAQSIPTDSRWKEDLQVEKYLVKPVQRSELLSTIRRFF